MAVDKVEIVGIVLVPCCYHHLTEVADLSEPKIPNVKSQFVTGIGRGLDSGELVTTEVQKPDDVYIGFPLRFGFYFIPRSRISSLDLLLSLS